MAPEAVLRHLLFCAGLAGLSAAVVAAMIRVGVLDQPVARSSHTRPTPKGGGVGVVAAFLVGIVALYVFADFARIADPYFRGVIGASLGIAVVSYLDDVRSWPFSVKLGAQAVAALVAVGSGLAPHELRVPWIGSVAIGWLGIPATVAWILVLTNAMNFIDGLNGLAAGSAAIACLFLAGIAAGQGDWFVYFAAAILAAGVLGFLPFNYPRARIFMGDVGSQFCGFTLAVLGVAAGRFATVELSLLLMPMLLAGVLFDVAFTLVRRLLGGRRITQAHRGHLYQVANRCGMNAAAVTLVYWVFVVWGGLSCVGFVQAPSGKRLWWAMLVVPPQLAWLGAVCVRARRVGLRDWG